MSFGLGVLLFAIGIGISIALHEAGHMYTAKAFGMKVRRYFIGFGPTLFSFRRGETEYGIKAIPAGGFCDIAGMTALDDLPDPEERRRAFFRYPTWKRVVVLAAGSATHFVLGIVLVYTMAVSTGLPNLALAQAEAETPPPSVVAAVNSCVEYNPDGSCVPGSPSPAKDAGLLPGDRVLAVAGTPVRDFNELVAATRPRSGPTEFLVQRDGRELVVVIDVVQVPARGPGAQSGEPVGTIGASFNRVTAPPTQYGPVEAVGQTFAFTGTMFALSWEGLKTLPERLPLLVDAIGGAERSPETPVSVVGASILGGDAVQGGYWIFFLYLLAALNFFVGVLNLLPVLPLDGGHIAVNLYERARNGVRRMAGRPDGPPVDYTRLLPLTYAVILVVIGVSVLVITADIVNPIRLSQ